MIQLIHLFIYLPPEIQTPHHLLRIQRTNRRIIINLDPPPLLLPTIMKRQFPPPFLLRGAQPQPHEMPPRCRRRVVLVRRPRVQDVVVGQELDVADVEDHVEGQPLTGFLQDGGGFFLRSGERRDEAGGGETGEGADVVGVPSEARVSNSLPRTKTLKNGGRKGRRYALRVHPPSLPFLKVKHTRPNPLLLPDARLPFPIKVPDRLRQRARHVRILHLQRVPDFMRGDEIRLPALQRLRYAQQAYQIGVIRVEELPRVGPVDAHAGYSGWVVAEILDVPQDVSVGVLRDEVAQVGA